MDAYKIALPLRTPANSEGKALGVLEQGMRAAGGWLPNMYGNMANSPGLLQTYLEGYDRFRSAPGFTPVEQEVVFLTVSRFNECTYCMAAHSFVGDRVSGVPLEVTDAIRADAAIPDARLEALAAFTRALLVGRGRPSGEEAAAFLAAGYGEGQMLDIILAISVKVLSNYTNRLFQTSVDDTFAERSWSPRQR